MCVVKLTLHFSWFMLLEVYILRFWTELLSYSTLVAYVWLILKAFSLYNVLYIIMLSFSFRNLSNNRIQHLDKGCLYNLTALVDLKLARNRISSLPKELFKRLSALKFLWVWRWNHSSYRMIGYRRDRRGKESQLNQLFFAPLLITVNWIGTD